MLRALLAIASLLALLACGPDRALAGPYSTSGEDRYIVFASRQNLDDAIGVARAYAWRFSNLRVMQSSNGWYAVAAGPERVPDMRAFREKLVREGGVAPDFLFSKGDAYVAEAWRKPEIAYALKGAYDGGARQTTFALGDMRITLGRVRAKDGDGFAPTAIGWRGPVKFFEMRLDDVNVETPTSEVVALRLDPSSPAPQVVFSAYWGGAHCCYVTKIATLGDGGWSVVDGAVQDGSGYGFEDVDGDGAYELVSSDDSFLYAFAPYVESRTPFRLWRLRGGRLVDATRDPRLAAYHRQRIATLEHEAAIDASRWRSNGFLAAWVATKALVGQFEEAWARMLVSYDPRSDWPLTECAAPRVKGECPAGKEYRVAFPVALRLHLERNGYVQPARPAPSAPVVAAAPAAPAPGKAEPKSVSGTGFIITAEGHVVTNSHVVASCTTIEARRASRTFRMRLLARDAANDLALLEAESELSAPPLAIRANVRLGEAVAAFGFPLSRVLASSGNFTLGNVTALAGIGDDTRYLQISAPVQPGNSGGPLLDENGNLVGVVTAKLNSLATIEATGDLPQNVNFAIKASVLSAFLESNRITMARAPATTRMSPPDLADRADAVAVFLRCE